MHSIATNSAVFPIHLFINGDLAQYQLYSSHIDFLFLQYLKSHYIVELRAARSFTQLFSLSDTLTSDLRIILLTTEHNAQSSAAWATTNTHTKAKSDAHLEAHSA